MSMSLKYEPSSEPLHISSHHMFSHQASDAAAAKAREAGAIPAKVEEPAAVPEAAAAPKAAEAPEEV